MEIILTQDIDRLGYQYDIVDVKPGYARNYLIPQGMAIAANKSNKKMVDEILRQQSQKVAKIKAEAQAIADRMGDLIIEIKTKAGESGKIFGAITPLQISEALNEKGFEIDRKKITISEDIKMLGTYQATVELHKDIKHEIQLNVTLEE